MRLYRCITIDKAAGEAGHFLCDNHEVPMEEERERARASEGPREKNRAREGERESARARES